MIKLDIKAMLILVTLLFAIIGFYYTAKNDIGNLSLKLNGQRTENHDIRKRLDALDKRVIRLERENEIGLSNDTKRN